MDVSFVRGTLIGISIGAISLAVPVLVRTYFPEHYTGIWRALGEFMPVSLSRLGLLVLGSLLGLGFVVFLQVQLPQLWNILIQPPYAVLADLGVILILVLAFVIGIRRWMSKKKSK